MAHKEQLEFVEKIVKASFPRRFSRCSVLEFGSRDINGSVRQFFTPTKYVGVDVTPGPGVDVVSLAHEYDAGELFDVVCSCEMLEHDPHYAASLANMVRHVRPGGLFFGTAAGPGRAEHGTPRTGKQGEAFYGPQPDWYRNVSVADVSAAMLADAWSAVFFTEARNRLDVYWYGVKEQ